MLNKLSCWIVVIWLLNKLSCWIVIVWLLHKLSCWVVCSMLYAFKQIKLLDRRYLMLKVEKIISAVFKAICIMFILTSGFTSSIYWLFFIVLTVLISNLFTTVLLSVAFLKQFQPSVSQLKINEVSPSWDSRRSKWSNIETVMPIQSR